MKPWLTLFCIAILGLTACQHEDEPNFQDSAVTVEENALIYQEALSAHVFSCDDPATSASSFFTGKIGNSDVCYVADNARYREMGYRANTSVYQSPAPFTGNMAEVAVYRFGINVFDNLTDDRILIQMPAFPPSASALDIVESAIRLGRLPLASDKVSLLEGFNVMIEFGHDSKLDQGGEYEDYLYTITLQTAFGSQDDSRLEVTDLVKTETDSAVIYDLTLKVSCNLYWERGQSMVYFDRLEQGVLRTRIVVER